eukprot:72594-Heterocapsa_arctica.AAC.1
MGAVAPRSATAARSPANPDWTGGLPDCLWRSGRHTHCRATQTLYPWSEEGCWCITSAFPRYYVLTDLRRKLCRVWGTVAGVESFFDWLAVSGELYSCLSQTRLVWLKAATPARAGTPAALTQYRPASPASCDRDSVYL